MYDPMFPEWSDLAERDSDERYHRDTIALSLDEHTLAEREALIDSFLVDDDSEVV